MSLPAVVEVVVGLSFLFATLSVIASGINEMIAAAVGLRAKTLAKGVENLLGDPAEVAAFYNHPVIRSLFRSPGRGPSYIPADKFALALLDIKAKPAVAAVAGDAATVRTAIQNLPAGQLRDTLDALWRDSKEDTVRFRKALEGWYDDTMERVSGWYRRRVQAILLGIGLALAIALNVNTLTVTQRLWIDAPLRAAVVDQVEQATPPPSADPQTFKESLESVESALETTAALSLPIGWAKAAQPSAWYIAAAGWALTALALSLGAPFWFDLLGRVVRLRSSGVRPATAEPPSAEREPKGT